MAGRLRRHLSPSLVISCIALFAAVGGGWALAARIDTDDLKNRSVTNRKIERLTIKNGRIADGTITGVKLAPDTLTGAQIDESSLDRVRSAGVAGHAREQTRQSDVSSPAGAGFFDVLPTTLPSGDQWIVARAGVRNDDAAPQTVECRIQVEGVTIDSVREKVEGQGAADDDLDQVTLQAVTDLPAESDVILQCDNPGAQAGDTDVIDADLIGLEVRQVSSSNIP